MAQITNCLKLISRINEGDQDSLISRIDELQALGVPAQRAQVQAAIDVLARLQRDAGGIQRSAKREPDWWIDGEVVASNMDALESASGDAPFVLGDGEYDVDRFEWRTASVPIAEIHSTNPMETDRERDSRFVSIEAAPRLERPILEMQDGRVTIIDGWHRIAVFKRRGEEFVEALVGRPLEDVRHSATRPPSGAEIVGVEDGFDVMNNGERIDRLRDSLQRDAGGIRRSIKREQALKTNVPVEMPVDPVFMAAVENTPGARVDDEGLHMRLVRWQKPEQEAGRAIRTGVFYLPEGSGNARHYRSAPSGDDSQSYGGSVKMEGETLIRRPLFVRGATGGKAPEAAYTALHGKEAMKKLDSDVFGVVNERAWMTRQGADIYQERVENLLRDYGADPQLAADIIYHSRQGNQLRYALQENIIAHAVRAAGYDAVVGHSKGKSGPFISEVFDVREQTFPSNIIESEVHQDFSSDITRSAKRSQYTWSEREDTADGPVLRGDGFYLLPQREIAQDDFGDGGFGENGLLGHAERVVPGTRTFAFRIVGDDGKLAGVLVSDVDETGALRSIHDIEIDAKRSGLGSKIVATIAANTSEPIKIQDITNEATPFWTRIGVGYKDPYGDASLDWENVAQYVGSRAAAPVDQDWTFAQDGSRGLSPDSYEVRELSPEELEGIQFSAKRNDLGFYSALERGIEGMQTKQAPAGAWKTQIKGLVNKGIVKQDEITWSGLEDWLDLQDGKVSKEAISEYLRQGGAQVQEVQLDEDAGLSSEERAELKELRDLRRRHEGGERGVLDPSDVRRLRELEQRSARPPGSTPKYGQYTLPGGDNYREVLLTLPDRADRTMAYQVLGAYPRDGFKSRDEAQAYINNMTSNIEAALADPARSEVGKVMQSELDKYPFKINEYESKESRSKDYRSNHWDQPNVVAHIRVNDRVDADGRKVLFVEELQSDAAQDRRAGKDVPPLPFTDKTDAWLNLALKRVIAIAVDGGYDAVAFVNGDQSADRYDLSKQVESVSAYKVDGGYKISAKTKDGDTLPARSAKDEGEIADLLGKELAAKIVRDLNADGMGDRAMNVYSGLDLKVGGEGMKAFYDKIVPNAVKALLKKVGGGQLEMLSITGQSPEKTTDRMGFDTSEIQVKRDPSGDWYIERGEQFVRNGEGRYWTGDGWSTDDGETRMFRSESAAKASISGLRQPGFSITESMREKVSTEGLPLFSRKRGWQGFPDSVVDTNLGAQSKDPSYEAAKAGDMKAALELVSRVMSSDAEDKVRSMIGDSKPIVVSVHAEEAAGRNKIPLATAIELGDRLGLEVDTKIVQSTRAKRTGADGMARIGVQPEFTGDVVRGADYLIVDDTLTQGGTIAQLKTYIEDNGGRVVGSFALSGKQYSAKISLDEQTLSQLREQYGSIEPWWRSELGYGFDGLTQSEARFILKSGLSPDQVRDRVAAARQAAGIGAGAQDQAQLSAKRDVTETPEFKAWFGDSRVVDADGKPLVVYHGTTKDFSKFRPADELPGGNVIPIFFTQNPDFASNTLYGGGEDGGRVMPVYLRAERIFDSSSAEDLRSLKREVELRDPLDPLVDEPISILSSSSNWNVIEGYAGDIRNLGYDAMIVFETNKSGGSRSLAVFDPRQIKSAIGNNGQFDPVNPDITRSLPRIPGLNAGPVEHTTGDYGREYTPQQLRMFKNVGRTTSKPALIDRLKEARKDLGKKMAQGIVDQFRPIKELGGNAYTLARLSKGAAGAFEALLGHGKLKIVDGAYDADTTGGFLDLVGKPLGKELEDFMFWVASNRAETLSLQDREHLFTQEDIDAGKSLADGDLEFDYLLTNGATTRDRRAAYEDALKKFNEFNKNVLDIAEQSGLIDGESRQFWEGEFYVPFYRVSEEDGEFVGAKIKGGLARQRAFHELKGGSQKLNSDLLANTMRNWAHLIDASAKNRAAKATLEAAQAVGIALESDAETVRQLGKSMGGKGGTVWFMDGGQQRHFLIGDPYLLEAINSLEYAGLRGPLMDALSTMKHWLTVGVTASPAFKVRNLIRDSIQAISLSGLSYNPVKNLVEGYKATDRASQDYVSALASGGLIRFGTMLEGNAAERVRRLVQKGVPASTILNTPGKVKDFYGKFVEPAVEAYQELGNRGEEINRASLYKQLRAQGINHAEASLMARDLMDFSMQGTWTSIRFLTQVVPFLNARLQGLYKLGRGAAEDPKRFAIVAGAAALMSVALLAAYGDDDDWKKREDWDRDGFWWFKFGGTAFRIPKPFEVGALATLAERGVELFTNDEFTAKRFGSRVMHLLGDNLSMNPIPQAVKPLLDVYANKDSFSGRPIESMGMERLQSEYRFNVNTSMVARGASSAMNAVTRTVGSEALSPVQIDSMIRGYFGWLGTFVVAGADMAVRPLTNEPARPQADYLKVVTQGFLKTLPEPSSKYVSAMYDQAKVMEQAYATHRQLLKEGKPDEAREFAAENKDLLERYRLIESVKKVQSDINKRIREIEISDMDPARKRDEIQKLRDRADRSARSVY